MNELEHFGKGIIFSKVIDNVHSNGIEENESGDQMINENISIVL